MIKPRRVPGLQGPRIHRLARLDIVTVSPITAPSNKGKGRHSTKRVEKTGAIGAESHTLDDGTKFLRRGRSYSAEHNLINEIGVAIVNNGVAVQLALARGAKAAAGNPGAPPGQAQAA